MNHRFATRTSLFLLLLSMTTLLGNKATAQGTILTGQNRNYISTGMPIILVAPDGVASGMGDAGVASTPDANSAHWNNAKFAFAPSNIGISLTYTPWLRNLKVSDMNLMYLGGYKKLNNRSAVAASLTYFSLGEINHTGEMGEDQGTFTPNELAFDITYALKLNENLSLGASGRFLYSDLTNGMEVQGQSTKPPKSLAADVGLYYEKPIDQKNTFAAGAFISNLGSMLSYSDDDTRREYLPANLRIGGRYTFEYDEFNKINFLLDFNKLLVPTPPIHGDDTIYSRYYHSMTEYYDRGTILGAIQSFYDAPGGIREELQEIQISAGAEYWYSNTIAVRAGYFYESNTKGGRRYLTFGVGLRYNVMRFDLSYLVPTTTISTNPLANTLRIALSVDLNKKK
ncbi:MAG: type IX secretion system outer membrane channel protein PorV [Bacteroidales bacterium]|nr:type IX secretion system outer membrane channel protein PorV [Bacteroidales bacterium]